MRGVRDIRARFQLPELNELAPELAQLARWEAALSLAVPWLCITIFALAAWLAWWPVAILATILLSFFTYGSISHDLVHANLGLPRRVNDVLLCITELIAIRSGHAYQAAHLHHHARYPADDDVEGSAAKMSLGRTLLEGVILQPKLWWWAVRGRRGRQAWIWFEGLACAAIIVLALASMRVTYWPAVYVCLMIAGSWIIPLITSYIPHDPSRADPLRQTRLFRGRVLSLLLIEHLYHLEHHLYPQVPHHHWAALARRLDPFFEKAGIEAIHPGGQPRSDSHADPEE